MKGQRTEVAAAEAAPVCLLYTSRHQNAPIVINATPAGMYPHNGRSPVNLADFPHCEAVFDLIYNPLRTALLLQAETLEIQGFNGLPMLCALSLIHISATVLVLSVHF